MLKTSGASGLLFTRVFQSVQSLALFGRQDFSILNTHCHGKNACNMAEIPEFIDILEISPRESLERPLSFREKPSDIFKAPSVSGDSGRLNPGGLRKTHVTKGYHFSKVVSTHLWNTPLNLYQQAMKGFLS